MRLNLLEITWEYIYFQGIKYLQEETKSDAAIEANLEDGDEEESRQQWSNPIEFLLSCVAMSVGLGKDLFRNGQNTQITLSWLVALKKPHIFSGKLFRKYFPKGHLLNLRTKFRCLIIPPTTNQIFDKFLP